MKKLLFVIDTLNMGGAQKALVNFLNAMDGYRGDVEIDLLLFARRGGFLNQVPSFVKMVDAPRILRCMYEPIGSAEFFKSISAKGFYGKMRRLLTRRKMHKANPALNDVQLLWQSWGPLLPDLDSEYDVAIGGLEGTCSYYVMDKVHAKRKVLWFHNNYADHGYDACFDKIYFDRADEVITVSDSCLKSLLEAFPSLHGKSTVLENITSPAFIRRLADEVVLDACTDGKLNLLTVGRFQPQKGYDILVDAANHLNALGIDFVWRCIGDGELRHGIQDDVTRFGLSDKVLFLGERENPYPYMLRCNAVVQTSRYEGKSIVLDEARALRKPVVVTDYATARDSVIDGETGLICGMRGEDVAETVALLWKSPALCSHIAERLERSTGSIGSPLSDYLEVYLA